MSKLLNYCCVAIALLALLIAYFAWHKIVLDEAQRQATMRLLGSFHKDYLRSAGLSEKEYIEDLKKYNREHSGILDEYLKNVESDKSR